MSTEPEVKLPETRELDDFFSSHKFSITLVSRNQGAKSEQSKETSKREEKKVREKNRKQPTDLIIKITTKSSQIEAPVKE